MAISNMVATNGRTVTVFGGTGFLGRRIVRRLRYRGFPVRIASRHPDLRHSQFDPDDLQIQSLEANIHDERSVANALADAYGVVNAVSLYVEQAEETFHSVHVESAQRVAAWDDVAFSSTERDRHLGIRPVSQLNTWPVVSPVNASRRPSRDAAHHSGSGRMASTYPVGDFHLLFFASFPGALRVGSNSTKLKGSTTSPLSGR